MTLKYSVAVRNARLDSIEVVVGTAPILRMYSGSPPANITDSATGDLLAEMTLPSDWMAAASGGTKAKSGTWEDTSANDDGDLGYWRIYDSGDTAAHLQGTITATGGGGDMTVDNVSVASGQKVTVTSFTLTAGNP